MSMVVNKRMNGIKECKLKMKFKHKKLKKNKTFINHTSTARRTTFYLNFYFNHNAIKELAPEFSVYNLKSRSGTDIDMLFANTETNTDQIGKNFCYI